MEFARQDCYTRIICIIEHDRIKDIFCIVLHGHDAPPGIFEDSDILTADWEKDVYCRSMIDMLPKYAPCVVVGFQVKFPVEEIDEDGDVLIDREVENDGRKKDPIPYIMIEEMDVPDEHKKPTQCSDDIEDLEDNRMFDDI